MSDDDPTEPRDGVAASTANSPPGYEVIRELGRGGMGVVYLARQLKPNRLVALKMILGGPHADPAELARFRAEAEAIARLQHPNIVQIFEVGEHQGLPFFSLEYCAGGSLAAQLNGTPQDATEAARLIEVLARAMQAAHDQQVVHRDLKPANVLLAATPPAAKITDFGLAKRLDEVGQTRSGAILGTASYMAPEQADDRAKQLGPAADVYALGAILYECLTGRPPFKAATTVDTILQVLHAEPVPPSRLAAKVPRDLETICLKCLHKEPDRRYPSARALADDLARFLRGEAVLARPVGRLDRSWRWARRNPALAAVTGLAAVTLLLALGLGVVYQESLAAGRLREEQAQTRAAYEQAETYRQSAQDGAARLALERGQTLCEQNETARGLLWLAHSLQLTPPEAGELEQNIRITLARWHPMIHVLERSFQDAHPNAIRAFSRDGTRYLTVTGRIAQIWDTQSGNPPGRPLSHPGPILAATFSRDGRRVLTGSSDHKARLWQTDTGQLLGVLSGHEDKVLAVSFSSDGRLAATGSDDGSARLWHVATAKPLDKQFRHRRSVMAVAFSPDDRTLLTGSRDLTAQLWDIAAGKARGEVMPHQGKVLTADFAPDGKTAATGSDVNVVQQWDAATGTRFGPALPHQNDLACLSYTPDGRQLVSGGTDESAWIWEARTGKPLSHPLLHRGAVTALACPDAQTIWTGTSEGTVRRWRLSMRQPFGTVLPHDGMLMAVTFSPDGRTALTASLDGTARFWDAVTGQPLGEALRHDQGVWSLAYSPDGKLLATGGGDGVIKVWRADTGTLLHRLTDHTALIWALEFSQDGKKLVSTSTDHTARLWDVGTGQALGTPMRHGSELLAGRLSPNGQTVLTASGDGTVRLWDASTCRPRGEVLAHPARVQDARFSPNGRAFATACFDGLARLWDTDSGRLLCQFPHQSGVVAVAFARGGVLLATSSSDYTARLWDSLTGKALCEPLRHEGLVWDVKFSPDEKLLLTGSVDGTARLWQVEGGKPWGPPLKHRGRIKRVAFSPDGRTILTGSGDHTARLWQPPAPLEGDPERIRLWAQVITGLELDASTGAVRLLDAITWQQRREQLARLGGPPTSEPERP